MARTRYAVTFPAARPGDEVTWPNTVKVYPDADAQAPLQSGQSLNESLTFSGWSDAASVVFSRPAGDNDTITVTSGSPSGTGAAAAPSGGSVPNWCFVKRDARESRPRRVASGLETTLRHLSSSAAYPPHIERAHPCLTSS